MRLSELLGVEVVDGQGRSAGQVHDVHLAQDGPPVGAFGHSFRVAGLVVGRRALGARLGYDRATMGGPAMVRWVVGGLRHGGRYVAWERIRSIEAGRATISVSADDLPPAPPSE